MPYNLITINSIGSRNLKKQAKKKFYAIKLSSKDCKLEQMPHDGIAQVNGGVVLVTSSRGLLQDIGLKRCRWCHSRYPYFGTPFNIQHRNLCPPCMEIDRIEKKRVWKYNHPTSKEGYSLTDAKRKNIILKSCWWCGQKTKSQSGYCMDCFPTRRRFMQQVRDYNRDPIKQRAKWRRSAQKHKKKKSEYHKQWRIKNKEKVKKDAAAWFQKNKARIREKRRAQRKALHASNN